MSPLPPPGTVRLVVPADQVELVSERLWWAGADAIGEQVVPDGIELLAGYPTVPDAERAAGEVADLHPLVEAVLDDSWMDAWKAFAEPVDIAGRVVLWPSWCEGQYPPDRIVVHLDAGRAFGSGSHPSTRLVVRELVALGDALHGARLLDVGCGSGVLSIAAVALGAARADAVDIEPVACAVTEANATLNQVADRVQVLGTSVTDAPDGYDLVVANIGAAVLRSMSHELARRAPVLILAGLLADQAAGIAEGFPGWHAQVSAPDEGWVAVVLRRDPQAGLVTDSTDS